MKTTIKKTKLLKAMQTILQEYKEKRHEACVAKCKLCVLYYTNYHQLPDNTHSCYKCPMIAFKVDDDLACLHRRCEPVNCNFKITTLKKLRAVIKFYEKAIEKVELMTKEQLNEENAFKFLIDIDNEIADNYKIGLRKKKIREKSVTN
jgi:hypothetical protein